MIRFFHTNFLDRICTERFIERVFIANYCFRVLPKTPEINFSIAAKLQFDKNAIAKKCNLKSHTCASCGAGAMNHEPDWIGCTYLRIWQGRIVFNQLAISQCEKQCVGSTTLSSIVVSAT